MSNTYARFQRVNTSKIRSYYYEMNLINQVVAKDVET